MLDTRVSTSAIELLRMRFCLKLSSFYDLEILNPRKINCYVLTVHRDDLLDTKIDTNPPTPILEVKPQFFREITKVNNFEGFPVCTTSLADLPIEFINWAKTNTRVSRDKSINSQYFAVPIPCAFTKELIDHNITKQNDFSHKNFIAFYTSEVASDGDNARLLIEIREHVAKL